MCSPVRSGKIPFLSTPSARRATSFHVYDWLIRLISIHALREEGDLLFLLAFDCPMDFYPRPPRGGRRSSLMCISIYNDFYPRPPRGGRLFEVDELDCNQLFLSTPSARRATGLDRQQMTTAINFYPRPPRGGRLPRHPDHRQGRAISIHALREEGDLRVVQTGLQGVLISIHALREEGDADTTDKSKQRMEFLSTPSARRATAIWRAAGGGLDISIHALREEGDP